jgi:hypothetical protein
MALSRIMFVINKLVIVEFLVNQVMEVKISTLIGVHGDFLSPLWQMDAIH